MYAAKNKGAYRPRGHRAADLRLFSHMQHAGVLMVQLILSNHFQCKLVLSDIVQLQFST